ncbi:DUF1995 family protein [Pseudanabaena sp. PCC 6802]|uniref:DUF1995 family protein n=1 Tax=Pseudanabaena sp. PCC 6802 TaxID=118173 RepID=UPI00034D1B7D|nr:DUF1995 family protein [Pseudanabaena sp. PCC 6802]
MTHLPDSIEEAAQQAIAATFTAIAEGHRRLLVDLHFPELKPMPIARYFAQAWQERYGQAWQALFSDAGAAALAKRDWADMDISMRGVNEGRAAIRDEDEAFLLVAPTSVEVDRVEKLLQLAGDRPFLLLNPRLENSEVGLGLSTRKMRDRFLSTFEVCYYVLPLEQGALWRCYPQVWQVWQHGETEMKMIFESEQRPNSDDLDRIFMKATGKRSSFMNRMQELFNALGR